MTDRYGISAEIDATCITLYDMDMLVRQLRKFGVDDEGENYSLSYGGELWVSDLMEEQVWAIVEVLQNFRMKITYVYVYDPDGDDVDEPIFDAEDSEITVQEALRNYLREEPDGQTRIEDFVGDTDED